MNRNSISDLYPVFASFGVILFLYFVIGLFTVMNQQFQIPLESAMLPRDGKVANALVTLLNFSWFLAYPFAEGFSSRWLDRNGYRRTSVYALLILLAGILLYEAAVLLHLYSPVRVVLFGDTVYLGFFVFLLGSFVVGVSMTVLQVVLNLYLDVVPVKTTTALQRQMIGGTVNSVGMALAPLFVSYLMFGGEALGTVRSQQFILPLALLFGSMVLIAFLTGRVKMPPLPSSAGKQVVLEKSIWSFSHVRLGMWGLFFYVGVEVAVGANINMYANELGGSFARSATHMAALYWGLLLVGRLLGSFIRNIPPQRQLTITSVGAVVVLVGAMVFANPWILVLSGFLHSVMWPAVFTLAVDKLGKYTAKASGVLMIGVVGGGILPFLQGVLADLLGGDWRWTWWLVIVGELYIFYYGCRGYRVKQTGENAEGTGISAAK